MATEEADLTVTVQNDSIPLFDYQLAVSPAESLDAAMASAINLGSVITEALAATAALSTGQQAINSAHTEALVLSSQLAKALIGVSLTDTLDTSSSVASLVNLVSRLQEQLTLLSPLSSSLAISASISSVIALIAALNAASKEAVLTESTVISDTISRNVQFLTLVTELLSTTGDASPRFDAIALVTSDLGLADSFSSALAVSGSIAELLQLELIISLDNEIYTGWVVNSEGQFPASEYTNWPFNSYAMLGNRVYGLSESGLYELTGDTDAGSEISSHILTGKFDFGSNLEKQVPDVQIGYTSDGTLRLLVRVRHNGVHKEYWYEMAEVNADSPRTKDVYLGRGLISNYWQFKLINVDGSDFHIDNIRLYPVVLSRKGR